MPALEVTASCGHRVVVIADKIRDMQRAAYKAPYLPCPNCDDGKERKR